MRLCLAINSLKCVCTNSTPSPLLDPPQKGTLCSDGARNIRRDALNSVLNTTLGFFFVQSTDATGKTKDAPFLFEDLAKAVVKIGGSKNVFIICLDGPSVCKAVLRMVNERMNKIFGQRCATHAWHLLLKDICKFEFMHVLSRIVRLLKFVVNHSGILVIFQELVVNFYYTTSHIFYLP